MIYAGRFIPYRDRWCAADRRRSDGHPVLKRFTSPIPSTVKICDRYPEHLAR